MKSNSFVAEVTFNYFHHFFGFFDICLLRKKNITLAYDRECRHFLPSINFK